MLVRNASVWVALPHTKQKTDPCLAACCSGFKTSAMSQAPGDGMTRFCASTNEPTYGKLSLTHCMHRIELFSAPPDVHVCLIRFSYSYTCLGCGFAWFLVGLGFVLPVAGEQKRGYCGGIYHDASVGPATHCPRLGSGNEILMWVLPLRVCWASQTLPETGERKRDSCMGFTLMRLIGRPHPARDWGAKT